MCAVTQGAYWEVLKGAKYFAASSRYFARPMPLPPAPPPPGRTARVKAPSASASRRSSPRNRAFAASLREVWSRRIELPSTRPSIETPFLGSIPRGSGCAGWSSIAQHRSYQALLNLNPRACLLALPYPAAQLFAGPSDAPPPRACARRPIAVGELEQQHRQGVGGADHRSCELIRRPAAGTGGNRGDQA